jgi:hypothetical protein
VLLVQKTAKTFVEWDIQNAVHCFGLKEWWCGATTI